MLTSLVIYTEQSRDDSINSSVYNPTLHIISLLKISWCGAVHCLLEFADLLSLHLDTFILFFKYV